MAYINGNAFAGKSMIYFDSAATGRVSPAASSAAAEMTEIYGNPSSPHIAGRAAAERLRLARNQVATSLGCSPERLVFTSGGTEANNLAVFSHALKNRRAGKKIITNLTEHPSVLAPVEKLRTDGYEVVYIPVTNGELDTDALYREAPDACLVAFMRANNQTGCLFSPQKIRRVLDDCGSGAMFHCDAVQAFCKTNDDDERLLVRFCDTVSISAHKIGGLKGCGALYHGERARLSPLICGGEQESGIRGGTENTVGIAAFGAACRELGEHPEYSSLVSELSACFVTLATAALNDKISFFTPPEKLDCIVNFAIKGLRSEVCLNYLSSRGICVSSSSACSTKAKKNTVLAAYGLPSGYTDCAVRIGFSHFNTREEVELLVGELVNASKFAR